MMRDLATIATIIYLAERMRSVRIFSEEDRPPHGTHDALREDELCILCLIEHEAKTALADVGAAWNTRSAPSEGREA